MYQVQTFKNTKNSNINDKVEISTIFNIIKNNPNKIAIEKARSFGKGTKEYVSIKESLPTARFNFLFDSKASNSTIIEPTKLIYIDVDNHLAINLKNPLIYACWKSVSNQGYSILVRVADLNTINFATTYNAISDKLGLPTDEGARKATQQTVLSSDEHLYHNPSSNLFRAVYPQPKKVSKQKSIISEKVSSSSSNDVESVLPWEKKVSSSSSNNEKAVFDNISTFFEDVEGDYIVFNEKQAICQPFIPNKIGYGKRNQVMYGVLTQYALLNENAGVKFLMAWGDIINSKFVEKYSQEKILSIVKSIIQRREERTLEMYYNKERKIIFNPKNKLSGVERKKLSGELMGKIKTDKTKTEIYSIIEDWNFELNGKITQGKVAEQTIKSVVTIKRYWSEFKDYVKELNKDQSPTENEVAISVVQVVEESYFEKLIREEQERKEATIEKAKEAAAKEIEFLSTPKGKLINIVNKSSLFVLGQIRITKLINNETITSQEDVYTAITEQLKYVS